MDNFIFITHTVDRNGVKWAGPKINAKSWAEAESQARELGVMLDGILREEHTFYTYDQLPG